CVHQLEFFGSARLARQINNGYQQTGSLSTYDEAERLGTITPLLDRARYETEPHLYVLGLRFDPFDYLALRVSRSIGFNPPTFVDTVENLPFARFDQLVQDVRRGVNDFPLLQSMYVDGGNPGLDPETTRSDNIGLILEPRQLRNFRLSADYTESRRNNAI